MKKDHYAVIFTSILTETTEGYQETAAAMEQLAKQQPGYLGIESARDTVGITVSYWDSLDAIKDWKANLDHLKVQQKGKTKWYQWYKVRICKIVHTYEFSAPAF